jgi:hypothetical protein
LRSSLYFEAELYQKMQAVHGPMAIKKKDVAAATVEIVEHLLKSALGRFESGDRVQGWRFVKQALLLDPGIAQTYNSTGNPIRANLSRILKETQLPVTLTGLAAICRYLGDDQASSLLLQRYIEVTPYSDDRDKLIGALKKQDAKWKRLWRWLKRS